MEYKFSLNEKIRCSNSFPTFGAIGIVEQCHERWNSPEYCVRFPTGNTLLLDEWQISKCEVQNE